MIISVGNSIKNTKWIIYFIHRNLPNPEPDTMFQARISSIKVKSYATNERINKFNHLRLATTSSVEQVINGVGKLIFKKKKRLIWKMKTLSMSKSLFRMLHPDAGLILNTQSESCFRPACPKAQVCRIVVSFFLTETRFLFSTVVDSSW